MAYAREGGHLPGNKKIFKIIDTACINGNKRAKEEIAKEQYTYFIGVGIGFTYKKAEFIKKEFLAKGIRIDYRYVSCMGEPRTDKFGFECYEKAMTTAFKNKYGAARLDSIDKALIKIYQNN